MYRGLSLSGPALFPASGPVRKHPLGSTGSRSARFPGFNATMRRSDSRPPYPTYFVLLRTPVTDPCACVRSARPDAAAGGLGLCGEAGPTNASL